MQFFLYRHVVIFFLKRKVAQKSKCVGNFYTFKTNKHRFCLELSTTHRHSESEHVKQVTCPLTWATCVWFFICFSRDHENILLLDQCSQSKKILHNFLKWNGRYSFAYFLSFFLSWNVWLLQVSIPWRKSDFCSKDYQPTILGRIWSKSNWI